MTTSRKEQILDKIEARMNGIKKANIAYDDVYYQNDVGYVDRQFFNITTEEVKSHPSNWVVINEIKEEYKALIGGSWENKIQLQIIGFVRALQPQDKLGTLMNSLQKDIKLAMLKDVELDRMCDWLVPVSNHIVDNLIYPYGGTVIYFDITYTTQGLEI